MKCTQQKMEWKKKKHTANRHTRYSDIRMWWQNETRFVKNYKNINIWLVDHSLEMHTHRWHYKIEVEQRPVLTMKKKTFTNLSLSAISFPSSSLLLIVTQFRRPIWVFHMRNTHDRSVFVTLMIFCCCCWIGWVCKWIKCDYYAINNLNLNYVYFFFCLLNLHSYFSVFG